MPKSFPFTRLRLPHGEVAQWVGYNPTFHRAFEYGLVITDKAIYVCRPSWVFARWVRIPLPSIIAVELGSPTERPQITIRTSSTKHLLRTPRDHYKDESDIDRGVLAKAQEHVRRHLTLLSAGST
jgi:hypothetical protein